MSLRRWLFGALVLGLPFATLACSAQDDELGPELPSTPVAANASAVDSTSPLARLEMPFDFANGVAVAIAADFDRDGRADLAAFPTSGAGEVSLRGSSSSGALEAPTRHLNAMRSTQFAVAGDVDGDGDIDLLASCGPCTAGDQPTLYRNTQAETGHVAFTAVASGFGSTAGGRPVLFDFDGDGDLDLLMVRGGGVATTGTAYYANVGGTTSFPFAVRALLPSTVLDDATAVVALDVNRDGRPDLYAGKPGTDALLLNQGPTASMLDASANLPGGTSGTEVALGLADTDGNGDPEIISVRENGKVVSLDPFASPYRMRALQAPVDAPSGMALLDITGDGRDEVLITSRDVNADSAVLMGFARQPAGEMLAYFEAVGDAFATPSATKLGPMGQGAFAVAGRTGRSRAALYETVASDADCDGMLDNVERNFGLDPADPTDAKKDPDGDHIRSALELLAGGDPRRADTDGDTKNDRTDLMATRDLDGDGAGTARDLCPRNVQPDQRDYDRDGQGDACDADPYGDGGKAGFRRYHVAWSTDAFDLALLPADSSEFRRTVGDRRGLMPLEETFSLLETSHYAYPESWPPDRARPLLPSLEVVELWNPTTRDHAYVTADGTVEYALLRERGYKEVGTLGYVLREAAAGSQTALLRRFRRTAWRYEETVTTNPALVTQLLATGYEELTPLGYVEKDYGKLKKPVEITYYTRDVDGAILHSAVPISEVAGLRTFDSRGTAFGLFPDRTGFTAPLYRMRDAQHHELLSSNEAEMRQFAASGYVLDGVLGYVVASPTADLTTATKPLFRLRFPDGSYRYTIEASEADGASQAGAGIQVRLLGLVVPPAPARCVKAPSLDKSIASLRAIPDSKERAIAALAALDLACNEVRVLAGESGTNTEKLVASALSQIADPDARARLGAWARLWPAIPAATRAELLGPLAALDPGACSQPVDGARATTAMKNLYKYDPGLPAPHLRTNFCDATSLRYENGDPGKGTPAESRTVTAWAGRTTGSEVNTTREFEPKLKGVLRGEGVRAAPLLDAAYDEGSGYPLEGVASNQVCSTDAQCDALEGFMCVQQRCRAYPIVMARSRPKFTGKNLWDTIDGHMSFGKTDGAAPRKVETITYSEYADDIRSTSLVFPLRGFNETSTPPQFYDEAEIIGDTGLETRFYDVSFTNYNGNFFEQGDDRPMDPVANRAAARTVHICWAPGDEVPSNPNGTRVSCTAPQNAATESMADGPVCGGANGGVWTQPPRSVAACKALDARNGCGETPIKWTSRPDTLPQRVLIETAPPSRYLEGTLANVHCNEETGWDLIGDDEFYVISTSIAGPSPPLGVPQYDLDTFGGVTSYNWDDANTGEDSGVLSTVMGAQLLQHGKDGVAAFLVQLGEDDEKPTELITIAAIVGFAAGSYEGGLSGGTAVGGFLAGVMKGIIDSMPEQDDTIGRVAWMQSLDNALALGRQTHDLVFDQPTPPHAISGSGAYFYNDVVGMRPSFDFWSNIPYGPAPQTCGTCPGGQVCNDGVCVAQNGWYDTTAPRPGTGVPGYVVTSRFWNGDESDYMLTTRWRIMDEPTALFQLYNPAAPH